MLVYNTRRGMIRFGNIHIDVVDLNVADGFLKQIVSLMLLQVFQVSKHSVFSLLHHFLHHEGFVVRLGLTLFQRNGILGAMPDAGAQAVAKQVADQPGLAVDDL